MAGLVPAIPLRMATPCVPDRDHRDKSGDDKPGFWPPSYEAPRSSTSIASARARGSVEVQGSNLSRKRSATMARTRKKDLGMGVRLRFSAVI